MSCWEILQKVSHHDWDPRPVTSNFFHRYNKTEHLKRDDLRLNPDVTHVIVDYVESDVIVWKATHVPIAETSAFSGVSFRFETMLVSIPVPYFKMKPALTVWQRREFPLNQDNSEWPVLRILSNLFCLTSLLDVVWIIQTTESMPMWDRLELFHYQKTSYVVAWITRCWRPTHCEFILVLKNKGLKNWSQYISCAVCVLSCYTTLRHMF